MVGECELLAYDITKKSSFANVEKSANEVEKTIIFFVRNKCHLKYERQVSYEEADSVAKIIASFMQAVKNSTSLRMKLLLNMAIKYIQYN